MVAEDDVDAESLQAQIDVSMSFAHNLVMSWIKPSYLAQLRPSSVNATQILEEELRRPPRLGVGASIPAIPPLAHEASKLKRKLGKNGAKNEGVVESQPQDSSKSDDEEHKGRPAKRKTKVDPFGHEGSKKKRKADSEANPYPFVENESKHSVPLLKKSTLGEPIMHSQGCSNWTLPDLLSSKERQRMGLGDQRPTAPSLSEPSRETSVPVPGRTITPESSRVHNDSMPMSDKAKPLGIPLLNLDGPPEVTDKPGNNIESKNSKRKRKRRKKKKTQMMTGTGDNSH